MANYQYLGKYLHKIILDIISSKDLCKLLAYSDSDALDKPDVTNPANLIFNNIFPHPRVVETSTVAHSYLTVIYDDFDRMSKNHLLKDGRIRFQIICHTDLWNLDGENLRPLSIIHEVDKIFNAKRYEDVNDKRLGVNRLESIGCKFFYVNPQYSGYEVIYKMTTGN